MNFIANVLPIDSTSNKVRLLKDFESPTNINMTVYVWIERVFFLSDTSCMGLLWSEKKHIRKLKSTNIDEVRTVMVVRLQNGTNY